MFKLLKTARDWTSAFAENTAVRFQGHYLKWMLPEISSPVEQAYEYCKKEVNTRALKNERHRRAVAHNLRYLRSVRKQFRDNASIFNKTLLDPRKNTIKDMREQTSNLLTQGERLGVNLMNMHACSHMLLDNLLHNAACAFPERGQKIMGKLFPPPGVIIIQF